MRRLKKKIFLGMCGGLVAVLSGVRACCPSVMGPVSPDQTDSTVVAQEAEAAPVPVQSADTVQTEPAPRQNVSTKYPQDPHHPIYSVVSFQESFPDVQDVQIVAAKKWGVKPVPNRKAAESRKEDLVYVGNNPYYVIDPRMNKSIPYLVPRASMLLQDIARTYLDSLYIKGIPLHRIIVSSLLRTEEDVRRLVRRNGNAHEQSCHRFGTTFDIAYNRYVTVSNPDGPERRAVQNDTLKWVLSEVLRDVRKQGRCYVKYEVNQGCFHITVR